MSTANAADVRREFDSSLSRSPVKIFARVGPRKHMKRKRLIGTGVAVLMLLAGPRDLPSLASVAAAADNPLVRAAAAGDGAAVRRLLKQGADVNAAGADGTTALHWTVRADDLEATDLLLRAGAKPSTP